MENLLFMNMGGLEIFLILLVLTFSLYCIFDIINSRFESPNANILWIIVVLVAPVIGSIIYMTYGRSQKIYH